MPKVSVIVPIYGVESYIERCARSLFEQTLEDIEYIFVNDCTKDNSINILNKVIKDYPNRENQIKIISHPINKGLSYARETGIKEATGDYIAHCDSDDWVDHNMYNSLYSFAISEDYDFVKSGRFDSDGKKTIDEKGVYFKNGRLDQVSVLRYLLLQKDWNSIWNALVKRSVYECSNIRFTPNAMLEDYYVVTQLILNCNKIGVLNSAYYYYFKNPNSISRIEDRGAIIKRAIQAESNINDILGFIHQKYNNIFSKEEVALLFIPRKILIPIMNNKDSFNVWKTITPGISCRVICSRYIPWVDKLWYIEAMLGIRALFK